MDMKYFQAGSGGMRSAGTPLDAPWTGKNGRDSMCVCIPAIERWLKDEINARKNCACPGCEYSKNMLRQLQNIVAIYKNSPEGKEHICNNENCVKCECCSPRLKK